MATCDSNYPRKQNHTKLLLQLIEESHQPLQIFFVLKGYAYFAFASLIAAELHFGSEKVAQMASQQVIFLTHRLA